MSKSNVVDLFPDIDFQKELEMLSVLIADDGELGYMQYMATILNHLSGYICTEQDEMFNSAFRMMCAIKLAGENADADDEIH